MTAVSFERAKELVLAEVSKWWADDMGTLMVEETGYHDQFWWMVTPGARELIIGGDEDYVVMDMPAYFVSKVDGRIETMQYLDAFDRIEHMKAYKPET